jgi:REP element-mobilizing transposase RayT
MPQSFSSLHCHIVFSTKNRLPQINNDWQSRLHEYIGGVLRNNSSALIAAGGMRDHIHLLVSLGRTLSVADTLRLIKTNSSRWVHDEFGFPEFQWQAGYGAFAVSYSNLDQVKTYIANQNSHHRTRTFQDEFRELLKRHGLEWDDRYVWD